VTEKNRNLHRARNAKKDEFYTQLADIGLDRNFGYCVMGRKRIFDDAPLFQM